MSEIDYLNSQIRKSLVADLKNNENEQRKKTSVKQFEIFKDRALYFVKEYLKGFYAQDTINEMPLIGSINLAKRVVTKEAGLYVNAPTRTFVGLTEDQAQAMHKVYADLKVNTAMLKANQMFKDQDQTHVQVCLMNGALKIRNLWQHQLDVVPAPSDPENADAYMITGFDKSMYLPRMVSTADNVNQKIGDPDDYKERMKRIAFWSDEDNFITDERGNIISEDTANPLGMLPFVDISQDKDSEYFSRTGESLTDSTIQFNAMMSDLFMMVRMQTFGQAWFKGSEEMIPTNIQIGPNRVLKLPINPDRPTDTDFGFANANADIPGAIQAIESFLSAFLSSRGLDPSIVNTKGNSKSFSSGIERLLAMIEMFEPSKSDADLFADAEKGLYKIIVRYINTYANTAFLPNFPIVSVPETSTVEVQYSKPEVVQSEQEKLTSIKQRLELGLIDDIDAIAQDRGISREAAEEIYEVIRPKAMAREVEDMNGDQGLEGN
jgi:hypothetical protein